MYLIKNNPGDARKLEMCFDCASAAVLTSKRILTLQTS